MSRERMIELAGYTTFFWLMFWLFAYWTFPYERLATHLSDKLAESGSGYSLEIGGLSPYWLTGVELRDVKLRKQAGDAPPAADPKGEKPPDQALMIETAHARFGLFALLTGSTSLSFGADVGSGEVDGHYEEDGDDKQVVATLSKVDLTKLGVLESLTSLPMLGTLSGEFDLTLGKLPSKTNGKVKLTIQKLTIGDGKAKLKLGTMGGLTIDPIAAGDVLMELDVKAGVGTVRKLNANGSDLRLEGSGDMHFAQPLSRARLNLLLRLKLTDAYKNKSPRTKAMFSLLEGSSSPQVAAAKSADGSYQLRLSGLLSSARVLPAGQRGDAAGPRTVPAAPAPLPPPDDEGEE